MDWDDWKPPPSMLGPVLKRWRESAGHTVEELAAIARVPAVDISRLEAGELPAWSGEDQRRALQGRLKRIAIALGRGQAGLQRAIWGGDPDDWPGQLQREAAPWQALDTDALAARIDGHIKRRRSLSRRWAAALDADAAWNWQGTGPLHEAFLFDEAIEKALSRVDDDSFPVGAHAHLHAVMNTSLKAEEAGYKRPLSLGGLVVAMRMRDRTFREIGTALAASAKAPGPYSAQLVAGEYRAFVQKMALALLDTPRNSVSSC